MASRHEQLGYQSQCRELGQLQRHQNVLLRSHREFSQPAHSDHPNTRKLEESMTRVHCDLSMLLDGFITGPDEGMEKPLRDDAGRLHDWMCDARAGADAEVLDELYARTGAILMGRRMFDVGVEPWGDPPPFHMPVSVLTHEARDPIPRQGGTTYTFVTDGIEAGLERARGGRKHRAAIPEGGPVGRDANPPRPSPPRSSSAPLRGPRPGADRTGKNADDRDPKDNPSPIHHHEAREVTSLCSRVSARQSSDGNHHIF